MLEVFGNEEDVTDGQEVTDEEEVELEIEVDTADKVEELVQTLNCVVAGVEQGGYTEDDQEQDALDEEEDLDEEQGPVDSDRQAITSILPGSFVNFTRDIHGNPLRVNPPSPAFTDADTVSSADTTLVTPGSHHEPLPWPTNFYDIDPSFLESMIAHEVTLGAGQVSYEKYMDPPARDL
jgi:hypothetical protein